MSDLESALRGLMDALQVVDALEVRKSTKESE